MDSYDELGIFALRVQARKVGVKNPTIYRRAELIKKIEEVESGYVEPYFKKTKQGRPSKETGILIKTNKQVEMPDELNIDVLTKKHRKMLFALKQYNIGVNKLIDEFLRKTKNL